MWYIGARHGCFEISQDLGEIFHINSESRHHVECLVPHLSVNGLA